MSDLFSFLGAVASHWVALMSGIVSLLITLVLRIKKVEPRDKIFWSIAAFCFFIAFFLAWRDEHVSVQNTKQELVREKDENVPKLRGRIEQVAIRESPDLNGTQVFVHLSIGNIGGPSKVNDFLLDVESPETPHKDSKGSDLQYKDKPAKFPKETISALGEKKSKVTIHYQESMDAKMVDPIERGDRVSGWLMFLIKGEGEEPENIQRAKNKFTISFRDVWGQTYSASYEMPEHFVNP
jgi:hypothetical protein